MTTNTTEDEFLPVRMVRERYHVTGMTLHRWLRDPRKNMPAPLYIGKSRFWRRSDLEAWERSLATRSEAA